MKLKNTLVKAALIPALLQAGQTKQPNIVLIMADDIGLGDISHYHRLQSKTKPAVETRNIDQLIKEGMSFSDAHSAASLSAPTRFSMLTGNYSYRNSRPFGVWTPDADALVDPNNTTSSRIAKAGGYATAFFGKWGLGGSWTSKKFDYTKLDAGALSYGFDYALELPEGIQNKPYAFYENRNWMKLKPNSVMKELDAAQTGYDDEYKEGERGGMGDSNWDPTLAGGILATKAVEYIANQKKVDPKKPFFIYYCSQAVHIPHTPPPTFNGVKIGKSTPGRHGDMIHELDEQVGMIIAALKKAGVYENTLFVFTSDNGGLNIDADMKKAGHDSSNGLSGKKGSINEGGHRVPFIAVWPGKIKPNSVSDEPIVGLDMVATIAALANQPIDRNIVKDAANLLPVFTNTNKEKLHTYLMHQSAGGPSYAIRDGEWKLILQLKKTGNSKKNFKTVITVGADDLEPIALYNLKDNLNEVESKNLLNKTVYKDHVNTMFMKYVELRANGTPTVNLK